MLSLAESKQDVQKLDPFFVSLLDKQNVTLKEQAESEFPRGFCIK